MGRQVAKRTRELLWLESGGRCDYCGRPTDPERRTIDHLVPRVNGGRNAPGNTIASCLSCNQLKGARTLEEFRAMMATKVGHLPRDHAFRLDDQPLFHFERRFIADHTREDAHGADVR